MRFPLVQPLDNLSNFFSTALAIHMRGHDDDTRKDTGSLVTKEIFTDRESEKSEVSRKFDCITRRADKLTFDDKSGDDIKNSEIPDKFKDDIQTKNE